MRYKTFSTYVVALAAIAAQAQAGFTVSVTKFGPVTVNGTPMDRFDITAVNTGGDTGTLIKGLEWSYSGSRVYFEVRDETDPLGGEPDLIPDTVNLLSNTLTRIRASASISNNQYVSLTPAQGPMQFNPYMVGVKQFSGGVANAGTTQATGAGFEIMRLFVLRDNIGGFLTGAIGGDVGSKVPFALIAGPVASPPLSQPPTIDSISGEPVVANFGSDVSAGAPFSVTIRATDVEVGDIMSLSVTPIPGIRDVVVSGGGTGTQDFVVTGVVDYSRLYNPTIVPFTVIDQIGSGTKDSFCVFAVPEPSTFAGISLFSLCTGRRRSREQ